MSAESWTIGLIQKKHEAPAQCWLDSGPVLYTLVQHLASIYQISRVYCLFLSAEVVFTIGFVISLMFLAVGAAWCQLHMDMYNCTWKCTTTRGNVQLHMEM